MDKIHKLLLELGATPVTIKAQQDAPQDASSDVFYYKFGPRPFIAYLDQLGHLFVVTPTDKYAFSHYYDEDNTLSSLSLWEIDAFLSTLFK